MDRFIHFRLLKKHRQKKSRQIQLCTLHFLLCIIFCVGCSGPQRVSLPDEASFQFIVVADPQLFRGKKADLDKAVQSINQFKPDFVVMCGDLVETPGNLQQIQAYKNSVSGLSSEITLYNLPGNHDLGRPVKSDKIAIYQEHFGPLWFHFEHGDNLFIALCSDIFSDPNAPMHQQQTKWLSDLLESSQAKDRDHIFILMHHPLYLNSPDEPGAYSNMPLPIRQAMLDLFVKHQVSAVFSGHYHNNRENCYHGVDLITTNSITAPMGDIPAGFRVVTVDEDGYEQTYYTLEALAMRGAVFHD